MDLNKTIKEAYEKGAVNGFDRKIPLTEMNELEKRAEKYAAEAVKILDRIHNVVNCDFCGSEVVEKSATHCDKCSVLRIR